MWFNTRIPLRHKYRRAGAVITELINTLTENGVEPIRSERAPRGLVE